MAARHTNNSPCEIIKHLQNCYQNTNLYDSLVSLGVNNWIDPTSIKRERNKKTWKLIENAECWISCEHYKSILDGKLELIANIKEILLGIRSVSLTINANFARNIILSLI